MSTKPRAMIAIAKILLPSLIGVPHVMASIPPLSPEKVYQFSTKESDLRALQAKLKSKAQKAEGHRATLFFDLPVTTNARVAHWLEFFQSKGSNWFRQWLELSTKYVPFIQTELRRAGLPTDLAYMVMIESGFNPRARSHANAVGPWQFIKPTAERYGLRVSWWLDERKDFRKATLGAVKYIRDLYQEFGSWYLVAASYNMGENGLRRRIRQHGTRDFWQLANKGALPQETIDYVPKILAAILISKAPSLYGFRDLHRHEPYAFDTAYMDGGTELDALADHLGVTRKSLRDMNAELLLGYIPSQVDRHLIRIPLGSQRRVAEYKARPFVSP